jgi:hypothetical protein
MIIPAGAYAEQPSAAQKVPRSPTRKPALAHIAIGISWCRSQPTSFYAFVAGESDGLTIWGDDGKFFHAKSVRRRKCAAFASDFPAKVRPSRHEPAEAELGAHFDCSSEPCS